MATGLMLIALVWAGIIGIVAVSRKRRDEEAATLRVCAFCLAAIPRAASVCRYCGRAQPEAMRAAAEMAARMDPSVVEGEVVPEPDITAETCTLDHAHGPWCRRRP